MFGASSGAGSNTAVRRRRSSHHRGRTARTRRRKIWVHFSRWNADFSDDDSDLLYFCRSKGLTRNTSSMEENSSLLNSNGNDKRVPPNKNLSPKAATKQEDEKKKNVSKYISLLCSFLQDKLKFIRESESGNIEERENQAKLETGNDGTYGNSLNESKLPSSSEERPNRTRCKSLDNDQRSKCDSIPKLSSAFFRRSSDKKKFASFPKILLRSEKEKVKKSEVKPLPICSDAETIPASQLEEQSPSSASLRRTMREWTAGVEHEIVRLYESGAPGAGLAAFDPQPHSLRWSQVKDQVESKLNNADHTPTYVLALANLFRKRMQIRKEFSQVSGQIADVDLKGSSLLPPPIHSDAFPPQHSKSPQTKSAAANESRSSVSLRYHHVTTEGGVFVSHSPPSSITKPRNKAMGFSVTSENQAQEADPKLDKNFDFIITSTNNVFYDSKSPSQIPEEKKSTPHLPENTSLSLPNEQETFSKLETLQELLTVFPKPPQFKFAGIQPSHNFVTVASKSKLNKKYGTSDPIATQQDIYVDRSHHVTNDGLTTSVISALRRSTKHVTSKVSKKPFDKQFGSQSRPMRHCFSAAQVIHKNNKWSGTTTNGAKQINIRENEKPMTSSPSLVSLEGERQSDDSLSFTFLPGAKVRWTGSLGTLYKRTPNEILQQPTKSGNSKFSLSKSTEFCAALSTTSELREPDDGLYSAAQSDLMTTSSLEKQSAFVV